MTDFSDTSTPRRAHLSYLVWCALWYNVDTIRLASSMVPRLALPSISFCRFFCIQWSSPKCVLYLMLRLCLYLSWR